MRKKKEQKDSESELLKSQLARALADYDNLRKRVEAEKELWVKLAGQKIVSKMISVLDILESAQLHLKDQGLAIAISEFKKILNEEGVEEIRPEKGQKFDANGQEAVDSVEGGNIGEIAELVLPGWKFSEGLIIRPAKVKVYGRKSEKKEELDKEMARGDYM